MKVPRVAELEVREKTFNKIQSELPELKENDSLLRQQIAYLLTKQVCYAIIALNNVYSKWNYTTLVLWVSTVAPRHHYSILTDW